jgi:hypothetical protein
MLNGEDLPVIKRFVLVDDQGTESPESVKTGCDLTLKIDFRIRNPNQTVNVGAAIFRTDNVLVSTFSSLLDGEEPYRQKGDFEVYLKLPDFRISEGEYNVVAYLFDENGVHVYDHRQTERTLIVVQEENRPGIISLYHAWER